ncbi:hypothetical protein [Calothrix sp. 336/3]|uniref:hypothetical protein n=1 Tax=Calothrix sp. 336/3 TaxID=1337936 RepID=UPI0004E3A6AD|nr:hypothetical protein [Calothrix sp. 336/3]AKG22875.1 hypothetical protein IJ00_17755 [Calothrix sp. 336/3]
MLRLYHLLLIGGILVLTPLGIRYLAPQSHSSTHPPGVSLSGNYWQTLLGKTSAPTNWQVSPCAGEAPLLCVSAAGKPVGTVEMAIHPLQKQESLRKALATTGILKDGKLDTKHPEYNQQVSLALKNWANENYTNLTQDRQQEYQNQAQDRILFSAYPPQNIAIGKSPGIRYGFVGLKSQGGIWEQHLSYAAINSNHVYVITTAFAPTAVTGKFANFEDLAVFEPHLSAIATNLKLEN